MNSTSHLHQSCQSLKLIFLLFPFWVILFSCSQYSGFGTDNVFYNGNSVHNRANTLTDLSETDTEKLSGEYSFIVISDVHIGTKQEDALASPDDFFLDWISQQDESDRPKFCLCLGDIADTGDDAQYEEYAKLVNRIEALGVKVFNTVGNHDLYQSGWDGWKNTCYPHTSFYRFHTAGFSYYALDTGTGTIGPQQMDELKSALENDSLPKIIFTHYPLYTDRFFFNFDDTTDQNQMIHYFAKNNVILHMAGHLHWLEKHDFGPFQGYALPSFRFKRQWTLVHIDEETQSYSMDIISAD